MKWLFAVLVALNLIVFGGMVAARVVEKQKAVVEPTVPLAAGRQELALPPLAVPQSEAETADSDTDAWITATEETQPPAAAADEAAKQKQAEEQKAAAQKAKEQQKREQERKAREAREDSKRREPSENTPAREAAAAAAKSCTASITLDEDDYHRIKGLLGQWPHAATRTVEQRSGKAKAAAPAKSYRVLLPTGGDAIAQLDNLSAKGFAGSLHEGEISIGIVRSKSAAQVLVSRAAAAGFGGARVQEQQDRSRAADSSLSVARMRVLFMAVDDKAVKGIQGVVGKYGKLARNCR